ncbi:MAG: hypothetical protein ACMG6S_17110 [Byssovorax sp.]
MRRLDPRETTILVIDVQEKLAAAMPPGALADVTRAATALLEAAAIFGARVIATEQYIGRSRSPPCTALRLESSSRRCPGQRKASPKRHSSLKTTPAVVDPAPP